MDEQEIIADAQVDKPVESKPKRRGRAAKKIEAAPYKEEEPRTDLRVEFYTQHPVYRSRYFKKGDIVELENEAEFSPQCMVWVKRPKQEAVDMAGLKPNTWRYAMKKVLSKSSS